MSKHAQRFVAHCLVLDPKRRPTASQLREHPWLAEHMRNVTPVPLSSAALASLKCFRYKSKFQKIALNMIAHFVDDEKVQDLQQMFATMDKDQDGTLGTREMKDGLVRAGFAELVIDFEDTMKELDHDNSGKVNYKEFVAATMNKQVALSQDYLWQAFKQFEKSNSKR